MSVIRRAIIVAALLVLGGIAIAAVTNPVPPSGQPQVFQNFQQARAISTGTVFPLTRAIYNGNSTACDATIRLNLDTTAVAFHNIAPGAILYGVMATLVTPTGCSNLVALY